MRMELTPAAIPDFVQVLSQAAQSYRARTSFTRPPAATVVQALLQAELAAKQQRLHYPVADLLGEWRLCFTTGVKKRKSKGGIQLTKGFYLPQWTPAQIGFFAASEVVAAGQGQLTITNQIQVGAVRLRFMGPAKYLSKKNLLAFDFTHMAIEGLGRTVFQTGFRGGQTKMAQFAQMPIAKLPFFAFFSVTPEWIAARGRGGGLALWIRDVSAANEPDSEHPAANHQDSDTEFEP